MAEQKGVFFFFSMLDNFNTLMEQSKYQSAYEYINAIRSYVTDGREYEGSDLFVQLLMNGDMKVMDSVQEKRTMGSNGGKANNDLELDDRIKEAIATYTFKTKAAIVNFVGGKRTTVLDHIKRLGFEDSDWLNGNQKMELQERENEQPKLTETTKIRQSVTKSLTDECPLPPLTNPLTNGYLTGSDKDKDNRQSTGINLSQQQIANQHKSKLL